jgi:hypothetical protein
MQEPDYMFLDPMCLIFCTVCLGAFLFGVKISYFSLNSDSTNRNNQSTTQLGTAALVIPLVTFTIIAIISIGVIGINTGNLALLLIQRGDVIKEGNPKFPLLGNLLLLGPVHMGILWWFTYRLRQNQLYKVGKGWMNALLCFSTVLAIGVTIAQVDRTSLMPIIVGLLPVLIFTNPRILRGELLPVLRYVAVGIIGVMGLFFLLSLLRGSFLVATGEKMLLGYSISSYNRLATVLNGTLVYSNTDNIQDLCRFCSYNPYLNKFIPYASYFNIPPKTMAWMADFASTRSAGLAGAYTFASAFAFVFRDIGWWTPLYFAGQGYFVGWAWRSFQKGRIFGLMLYPWCAFTVLFWVAWNVFLNDAFFYLCGAALLMWFYESYFGRNDSNYICKEYPAMGQEN